MSKRLPVYLFGLCTVLCATLSEAQTVVLQRHAPKRAASPSSRPHEITAVPVVAIPIRSFKLLSPTTGWASTGDRLLWTTDNGQHWKDISPSTPSLADTSVDRFSGTFFLNTQDGWTLYLTEAANKDHTPNPDWRPGIYHTYLAATVDGGTTWTTVSELPRPTPWQEVTGGGTLAFSDDLHGWVDLGVSGGGVLFATSDGGRTWRRPKGDPEVGVDILALTETTVFFAGGPDHSLFVSDDAADTVQEISLTNPPGIPPDLFPIYSLPVFMNEHSGYEVVNYRGPLGSKSAAALFATRDGGHTWNPDRVLSNLDEGSRVESTVTEGTWIIPLASRGGQPSLVRLHPKEQPAAPVDEHSGKPGGCRPSFVNPDEGWLSCQGILFSTADSGTTWTVITPRARNGVLTDDPVTHEERVPVQMKSNSRPGSVSARPKLASPADEGMQSGISEHLGFDSTEALPLSAMQIWWNSSPYYDVAIYLPGSPNRSSRHTYATADWVTAVSAQGWGIWPIWFGLQAPCVNGRERMTGLISTDPAQAALQGIQQADLAYSAATNLGLDGTVLYFDVEPYDTQSGQCGAAVRAYVGGFVCEIPTHGCELIEIERNKGCATRRHCLCAKADPSLRPTHSTGSVERVPGYRFVEDDRVMG